MARFGVEEEFVLLDEQTLVPSAMSSETRERILDEVGGGLTPEYLTCQLESATEPASTITDARTQLLRTRGALGAIAAEQGVLVASTGTPFISPNRFVVSSSAHYDAVSAQLVEITREHEVNGLHIHVEVPDDEERVRVVNRVRAWLPPLLALTGNSPFAHGRDSGFASWRSILIRRLPASWSPPHFRDLTDYRAHVEQLVAMGAIAETSSLSWSVRLSERFPTVEVRVFDAQLTVEETLLAVALTRALMLSDALDDCHRLGVDAIDASLWTAARYGPDARLVDPSNGEITAASTLTETLLHRLRPTLAHLGDDDLVTEGLARIRAEGTGAQRQQAAYAQNGSAGLRDLYRSSTRPD
ncbi:YbdK family carboxylate-amine ligase [Microbacterium sp. ISL-103]|uniref:carboxylate-amine ligase n=1 Tax=Microbacterium sp. ISL-103 TaxID=2819156 RepID=UPI001BEC2205|nr:YbdK family carboxylate-amine ligase [Microbacterium sp. ISL-103]MBT2475911.1 YbdK family carboxylate-amine ligase [Microbacterium sp. ISL-103]